MIYLYNIVEQTEVLGYGKRFAIWFQGCDKRCRNCIVPDSWNKTEGGFYLSVKEILFKIIHTKSKGVTISGGEPFLQNLKLLELVLEIKKNNLDIIVYTGYKYKELLKNKINNEILNNIDLLIDGEYIDELNIDTPLIGSSNQGLYVLSNYGYKLAYYISQKTQREVEFLIKDNNVFMVGIPPKNLDKKLKEKR